MRRQIDNSTYWLDLTLAWEFGALLLLIVSFVAYQPHFAWWGLSKCDFWAQVEWDLVTSAAIMPFALMGVVALKEAVVSIEEEEGS